MNDEPHVVFLSSSLQLSGGVLFIVQLATGLVGLGYRVSLVTSHGNLEREVQQRLSSRVRILTADLRLTEASGFVGKAQLSWQMARLVPPCEIIIATHTPTVVPAMLSRHLLARGQRTIWFHQDYPEMFEGRPMEQWLLRNAPQWFDRVITISGACREEIKRTSGVSALVVPQGYSITGELPERAAPPPGSKVVLYVGDRRPRKGWYDVLAAAELLQEHHPDLRLAIATKEPGQVDTSAAHDIYLRPSWDKLLSLYRTCRVFVSASWWEGFGRPPLEAMACGTPVVTTDSRGVREYAKDGVNCLMTPIHDPPALATAIDRVLSDQGLAQRLGDAGRQTALEFTWERSVASFVRAFERER